MVFNSAHFLLFFIIVTLMYFSLNQKGRWILLLAASCYFYLVFKPIYILILFGTILIDYWAGILIEKAPENKKKAYLIISLISNIGILAYFKYFNFLNLNLSTFLNVFQIQNPVKYLEILLPIGLSFHTFQAMSYTIEVYRGNQKAETHFGYYALYVMFYPQLVAGPIERPQNVLHQLKQFHPFNWSKVKLGLMLMAWGMFKKVVIADRLALVVDYVYANPTERTAGEVFLGTFFYCFQIYCDFSGYSDIAIGAARIMGIDLMQNFDNPYLATSISNFWRRWHISLSTWFRDYLYIPMGGNKYGFWQKCLNLFIVFLLSGLWHGAKYTFVFWGMLHGVYLVLAEIREKYLPVLSISLLRMGTLINSIFTFLLVWASWIFFRAKDFSEVAVIFKKMLSFDTFSAQTLPINSTELIFSFLLIIFLILMEKKGKILMPKTNVTFSLVFLLVTLVIYIFGVFNSQQFIYFQF